MAIDPFRTAPRFWERTVLRSVVVYCIGDRAVPMIQKSLEEVRELSRKNLGDRRASPPSGGGSELLHDGGEPAVDNPLRPVPVVGLVDRVEDAVERYLLRPL